MKIKKQTITGGSQQFSNKIGNKNINIDEVISTDGGYVYMSIHNNKMGDIAEGEMFSRVFVVMQQ